MLPKCNFQNYSLGEGDTPLTKASNLGKYHGFKNLYIKHEELNPTGSFKDRESVIAISVAVGRGLDNIAVASSGNAALSLAAYAKKAHVGCYCFVPAKTSQEKKNLISLFGAKAYECEGNYEATYRYVADHFAKNLNFTSGIFSERVEGNKTIAYEIWEKIGVPDVVIVPCGNGGNLAGIWKGFQDLKDLGKVKKVPRMIGVQIKGAAPLFEALKKNKEFHIVPNNVNSIAEGILAEESYCSPKATMAIRESKGRILLVEDEELLLSLKKVIEKESMMIEPTSAAAFAVLPYLKGIGISSNSTIVVICTGSGMKMLSEIQKLI